MKKLKLIISLILMLTLYNLTYATTADLLPPKGELTIENATLKDGKYFTSEKELKLNITASDNKTQNQNLKMLISTKPLTGDDLADSTKWQVFSSNPKLTLEGNTGATTKIYVYLKDEAGNISPNVVESTKQFTITYVAEGATNVPEAQTAICGLPFRTALKEPKMANKYFRGWSLSSTATTESWLSEDVVEPRYISADATLYAVWGDTPKKLSETVKIGDFVEYPVKYENVSTNGNSNLSRTTEWEVLDITGDTVKLITSGTPLVYEKTGTNSETITSLTTNFLNGTSATYKKYGFTQNLSGAFNNVYTKSIESIKTSDITKLTGETNLTNLNVSTYGGTLTNHTYYFIAGEADSSNIYYVNGDTGIIGKANGTSYGIRPVVTLSSKTLVTGRNNAGNWELAMPNITITLDNGTNTTTKTVTIGEAYGELPTPTKTGYAFKGWYNENDEQITAETIVTEDTTTLTAKWEVNSYTITFNTDGGSTVASLTQDYGTSVTAPVAPTKTGYTFSGWTPSLPTTMPAENITVTAVWQEVNYSISYNLDGGAVAGTNQTSYTTTSNDITVTNPTKEGHEFTGWTEEIRTENWSEGYINETTGELETSSSYPNSVYSEKILLEEGTTYTIESAGEATLRVYNLDGTYKEEVQLVAYLASLDENFLLAAVNGTSYTAEKDCYVRIVLANGATQIERESTTLKSNKQSTVTIQTGSTGHRNYTANYTANSYTITFNTNGGTAVAAITKNYGTSITAPANPTKTGYSFAGWTPNLPTTMPAENLTLTASWTPNTNTKYTVYHYFENANDTGYSEYSEPVVKTGTTDASITLANEKIAVTGGTYSKGSLTQGGSSATITTIKPDGTTEIHLYYTRNKYTLTVSKDSNITSVTGAGTHKYGATVPITAILANQVGYTYKFTGWTTTGTVNIKDASSANTTLTMPNGNIEIAATASKTANTGIKYKVYHYLENVEDTNYTQYGDVIEKTGTTDASITLANEKIAVTGGTYSKGTLSAGGATATTTTIKGNGTTEIHLYYTRNKYTLTVNKDENIASVTGAGTYKYGATVSITATLGSVTGHTITFAGWTTEDNITIVGPTEKNASVLMPNGNVTVKATTNKTVNSYTVTFNANRGTITTGGTTTTRTVTYGSTYGETGNGFPEATRSGYKFLGWFTAATGGTEIKSTTTVGTSANNQTLYAHWEIQSLMDLIPSKANEPVLGTGMKAVYWTDSNGNGETTATSYVAGTYNYTIGDGKTDTKNNKWANAITTSDESYWVWIPRYAYKITYTTSSAKTSLSQTKTQYGNIDILFMYGTSNTHYRDINGNAVELPEGYKVHPAFQAMTTSTDLATNPLGKWDKELEGIWVAKYEASMEKLSGSTWTNINTSSDSIGNVTTSSTLRMVSKPSVISWRTTTQSNIYANSQNMHTALNSHQMKNSEWGAVAYLTQSAYGRNGNEIGVNQCETYYTGAGPGTGTSTIYNSTYVYDSSTYASTYAWNTTQGKLASTTGNIYGVYDMSGGAYEYTAAYVNNGDSSLTSYGANLVNATDLKTKQVYAVSTSSDSNTNNYSANSSVYGDALYETSTSGSNTTSWNSDFSNFPYSSSPFFGRGGNFTAGGFGGAFYFNGSSGYHYSDSSFRPVLCVEKKETYEVTFNANGGTIEDLGSTTTTRTVTEGSTYGEAEAGFPSATRSGYKFLGWFTAVNGGTQVTANTVVDSIASALTLYARWEETAVTLTANAPVLGTGMKAVYWSDDNATKEIIADEFTPAMYSYIKGDGKTDSKDSKWANAITESDGSYWVWIPRYAYKITYYTSSAKTTVSTSKTLYGDIDILFMKGLSDIEYYDEAGNTLTGLPEGYKVHPAFQAMTTTADLATNPLGKWDDDLEGIWVAKYEASRETSSDSGATWVAASGTNGATSAGSSRVVSKPSVTSWRSISQNYIYQNSLNMHPTLNSHEMKNSEWGAVAYLTHSSYGRNGNEIAVNECSSSYTGAGPGTGTSTIHNTMYLYDESNFSSIYAWNTTQGKLASTTGNIYGVYDMSGGAEEYTAAYVNNGNSSLTSWGTNLINATDLKTKQVYAVGSSESQANNYNANSSVYGDAVYETSTSYSGAQSWNSESVGFPRASTPFFKRGGAYSNSDSAGVFSVNSSVGGATFEGFRPVLCVASGTTGEDATTYEVTFNANGGTIEDLGSTTTTRIVTEGSTYGEAEAGFPSAIRSGYKFLGWFTAVNGGTQVTANTVVDAAASALTLYAHWQELPDETPPEITITEPTTVTVGSNTVTVSGTVIDNKSVISTIKVNDTTVTVNANGEWTTQITILDNEFTEIEITATDEAGNTARQSITVIYETSAPYFIIYTPESTDSSNPTYTDVATYTVEGMALDKDGDLKTVTVNGTTVTVNADNTWSANVTLTANTTNTITIKATDKAGNATTEIRYMYYEPKTAYAVYSSDDNSLRFYKTKEKITAGGTYNGLTVTEVWTGIETAKYEVIEGWAGVEDSTVPWYNGMSDERTIEKVIFEDEIKPISTAYWFYYLDFCTTMDLKKLNTSKVTDMSGMFWECWGLEKLDLSGFDTSNVTDMSLMFHNCCTLTELDLSAFDTSKVTDMNGMFYMWGDWLLEKITLGVNFVWKDRNYDLPTSDSGYWYNSKGVAYAPTEIPSNVADTYVSKWTGPALIVDKPSSSDSAKPTISESYTYTVSGTVADDASGVKSLTVNGTAVTVNADGTWSTEISVTKNVQTITVVATNNDDQTTTQIRYVRYGELTAYAVYSRDDNSLRFYNTEDAIIEGSTYNGRKATKVFTGFENAVYTNSNDAIWKAEVGGDVIKKVVVEDEITPISTAYWFERFENCSNFDLRKLNTSKVTDMNHMFYKAGHKASSVYVSGLENWNTSNVTNMGGMFQETGFSSSSVNIGDLSKWDTSNATNMNAMFNATAYSASTFEMGDISTWDTSNVTNMGYMLGAAGVKCSNFYLDLSGWNVEKVTNYSGFNNLVTSKVIAPKFK